jgi:hypothetical protein
MLVIRIRVDGFDGVVSLDEEAESPLGESARGFD